MAEPNAVLEGLGVAVLENLQRKAGMWRGRNFPDQTALEAALGVCEEAGELAHSVLKHHQGIRGTKEYHVGQIADAIGDMIIFACGVADHYDLDMDTIVRETWAQVARRDWTNNKEDGS